MSERLAGEFTMPPPVEITCRSPVQTSASACDSSRRNASSPSSANTASMDLPAMRSSRSSVST